MENTPVLRYLFTSCDAADVRRGNGAGGHPDAASEFALDAVAKRERRRFGRLHRSPRSKEKKQRGRPVGRPI
jgi:hypothetical protein